MALKFSKALIEIVKIESSKNRTCVIIEILSYHDTFSSWIRLLLT